MVGSALCISTGCKCREKFEKKKYLCTSVADLVRLLPKIHICHACVNGFLVFISLFSKCLWCRCIVQIIAPHCLSLCPQNSLWTLVISTEYALCPKQPWVSLVSQFLSCLGVNHLHGRYRGRRKIEQVKKQDKYNIPMFSCKHTNHLFLFYGCASASQKMITPWK